MWEKADKKGRKMPVSACHFVTIFEATSQGGGQGNSSPWIESPALRVLQPPLPPTTSFSEEADT